MTTFYICRHGETENNRNQRLSGWIDTPLTDTGIGNATAAATNLANIRFDRIVSSDLGRAFTTAYIIGRQLGYSAAIEPQKSLREVNYGEFANQPISAYPQMPAVDNTKYVPLGGESLAQMQQRVIGCIREIAQMHPDETILIVAHDGTINAIIADYSHEDIGVVDATRANQHDMVARFTHDGNSVISYDNIA